MAWKDPFGEVPTGPLESWEQVWGLGREQFTVRYRENAERRGHSPSIEEFEYALLRRRVLTLLSSDCGVTEDKGTV